MINNDLSLMMNKDENGFARSCHFLRTDKRRPQCSALVDFYNAADLHDQCGNCPFFKTDDEFNAGWNNRRSDLDG
ncbi:MAG: hypothetical protein IJH37_05000 [Clostridia bacterium]|nr:hypothetical protein [Clostridia bacterium]